MFNIIKEPGFWFCNLIIMLFLITFITIHITVIKISFCYLANIKFPTIYYGNKIIHINLPC